MSKFELYSYGSPDCSSLEEFEPTADFFLAIELDISEKDKHEDGLETFYFFLCNQEGLQKQSDASSLKFIKVINEYSHEYLSKYLNDYVISKLKELDDSKAFEYLNENFIHENENSY